MKSTFLTIALVLLSGSLPSTAALQRPGTAQTGSQARSPLTREQLEVLSIEEQYRQARLQNDVRALDRILSDDYSGTNQNGHTRSKADTKELFKTFKLTSLKIDKPQINVHGETAVVTGFQTESTKEAPAPSHLRFVRVYVKQDGRWQLLASEQVLASGE
ncbi:MAG TPA: nuclear transport factor 2 family protein [Blastocatellia bacterium]|nr:nuclear transport factor 2 family protein [Blastocatellia bacterium]